jgi:hypothetical protein
MEQNWNHGDPLPFVQDAMIDPQKFEEYSMNPNNLTNQGKWIAFAALGYDVQSASSRNATAQDVIRQLRQGLSNASATPGQTSIYGLRFQVRMRIQGLNAKQGTLVTSWQIDHDKDVPRLITNWLEVDQ